MGGFHGRALGELQRSCENHMTLTWSHSHSRDSVLYPFQANTQAGYTGVWLAGGSVSTATIPAGPVCEGERDGREEVPRGGEPREREWVCVCVASYKALWNKGRGFNHKVVAWWIRVWLMMDIWYKGGGEDGKGSEGRWACCSHHHRTHPGWRRYVDRNYFRELALWMLTSLLGDNHASPNFFKGVQSIAKKVTNSPHQKSL